MSVAKLHYFFQEQFLDPYTLRSFKGRQNLYEGMDQEWEDFRFLSPSKQLASYN